MPASSTDQAKELLSLIATPSGLVTGTLLAFAHRSITKNQEKVNPKAMRLALAGSLAATSIAFILAGLMTPLALKSAFINRGGVEPALVIYWVVFFSTVGVAGYAVTMVVRCVRELRRPHV